MERINKPNDYIEWEETQLKLNYIYNDKQEKKLKIKRKKKQKKFSHVLRNEKTDTKF